MSQELKKSTELTLERFYKEQEQLEKLAFDILNLSDTIQNTTKKAIKSLEAVQREDGVEKEKEAILYVKDCLCTMLESISELSEAAHEEEAAYARQQENLETIRMAIDFLCCDWDSE